MRLFLKCLLAICCLSPIDCFAHSINQKVEVLTNTAHQHTTYRTRLSGELGYLELYGNIFTSPKKFKSTVKHTVKHQHSPQIFSLKFYGKLTGKLKKSSLIYGISHYKSSTISLSSEFELAYLHKRHERQLLWLPKLSWHTSIDNQHIKISSKLYTRIDAPAHFTKLKTTLGFSHAIKEGIAMSLGTELIIERQKNSKQHYF